MAVNGFSNGRFGAIKTVVFDLDDTLRYNDPHAHQFFCDFVETLAAPLDGATRREAQRWEHRYWASSPDLKADIAAFGEGSEAFWLNYGQRHLRALGLSEAQAQEFSPHVHAHMRDSYKPQNLPLPEVQPTVSALRRAGYSLGVITNRTRAIHPEMHTLGLDLYFDFYLSGGQLGAYKPSKEIFDGLLGFIGRPAAETLYVGDNYYADILGARNAGLESVLLNWHGLYDEVDCPSITSFADLLKILH